MAQTPHSLCCNVLKLLLYIDFSAWCKTRTQLSSHMTHKTDLWKVECLRRHDWRKPLTFGIKTSWERGKSVPGHRPEITDGFAFCPAVVPQTKQRSQIIVMKREILFNKAPIFIQKDILSLSPWIFFQSLFFWFSFVFFGLWFWPLRDLLSKSTKAEAKRENNQSDLTNNTIS